MRSSSRLLLIVGTIIVLALFGCALGVLILSNGVCCYDDASFAVLAKNLAEGRGYTLTLSYGGGDFAPHAFDPLLGNGPVSILPVAATIVLFGAKFWVPGATHVFLELALLAFAVVLIGRVYSAGRVILFLASSLILVSLLSARHLPQWYALFGETISALLILCAFLAWSTREPSLLTAAVTGLLLGLAVMAKELAGLYVMTFITVVIAQHLIERREIRFNVVDIKLYFTLVACAVAPFALFELWRLATLGRWGFVNNWREHFEFIRSYGSTPSNFPQVAELVVARMKTVDENFYIGIPVASVLAVLSMALVKFSKSPKMARAAVLLGCGVTVHTLYWLFASNGRARYLYIALVLWCFLIALPLLGGRLYRAALAYVVALAIACAFALPDFRQIAAVNAATLGARIVANEAERQVSDYLDQHAGTEPVYTSWWAHIAGPEYFSRRAARFQRGALQRLRNRGSPIYVIINTRLVETYRLKDDLALIDALASCGGSAFASGPYEIFYCVRQPM